MRPDCPKVSTTQERRTNGPNTMKLPRRRFLQLAAAVAALPAVPRFATAQTYPTRTVRLIGGGAASDLWCQIHANVLDRKVERVRVGLVEKALE